MPKRLATTHQLRSFTYNNSIIIHSTINVTRISACPSPPTQTSTVSKALPSSIIWSCAKKYNKNIKRGWSNKILIKSMNVNLTIATTRIARLGWSCWCRNATFLFRVIRIHTFWIGKVVCIVTWDTTIVSLRRICTNKH